MKKRLRNEVKKRSSYEHQATLEPFYRQQLNDTNNTCFQTHKKLSAINKTEVF